MSDKQQTDKSGAAPDRSNIINLGAAVPRTDDAPSPAADLSNVIPFARRLRLASDPDAPAITIAPVDRLAPATRTATGKQVVVLIASIAIHGAIFASLWPMPDTTASVGIEAITVDVVVGADTAAGIAATPTETEAQESIPAEEVKQETKVAEQTPITPEEKQDAKPKETPPDPNVVEVDPLPDQAKAPVQRKETRPSVASAPSSGIGRGGSQTAATYGGLVAAQLARHKQYPTAARGNRIQGTGTVTFAIDGSGRVTSASIAKSAGAPSLDQELIAMVHRASPFPAPPGGKDMSFTVPVTFRLN